MDALKGELGARRVAPLYGSVDPEIHQPVPPLDVFRGDLSYLGTYAEDRQEMLHRLFIETARQMPDRQFVIAGALYPHSFPWTTNIRFVYHLAPSDHAALYCSSRLTLNVTRRAMAEMGYCPSGRLFEAAACATPVLSDWWEGLDEFFEPDREILVAHNARESRQALELSDAELASIGQAARRRALAQHTADHRAEELETILLGELSSVAREPAAWRGFEPVATERPQSVDNLVRSHCSTTVT